MSVGADIPPHLLRRTRGHRILSINPPTAMHATPLPGPLHLFHVASHLVRILLSLTSAPLLAIYSISASLPYLLCCFRSLALPPSHFRSLPLAICSRFPLLPCRQLHASPFSTLYSSAPASLHVFLFFYSIQDLSNSCFFFEG